MNNFRLSSDYKPTGDQPAAIKELVGRLEHGEKEQTLLGVTGSGKSVTGDMAVQIRRGTSIVHTDIAQVINPLFDSFPAHVQTTRDSEYIDMASLPSAVQFETVSFSPVTGKASWSPVYQVSRHSTQGLMDITTACGRSITATTDHNFYTADAGTITLVDGKSLKIGDMIPTVREVPALGGGSELTALNLADLLRTRANRYYISGCHESPLVLAALKHSGVESSKLWRILHERERVGLDDVLRGGVTDWQGLRIGSYHQKYDLPVQLSITDALLRFLGYYIAEGCYTQRYITISNTDKEVIDVLEVATNELGVALRRRQETCDYQITSVMLAELLCAWCGRYSSGKHLPAWWPELSARQLGILLGAYFDGDGSVERQAIMSSTTSKRLASDLQYALQTLGIPARCRRKNVIYKDKPRENYVISISGIPARLRFRDKIPLLIERKRKALEALSPIAENTNVDVIPLNGAAFRSLRVALGMTQSEIAIAGGRTRTLISLIESGRRWPSYDYISRACQAVSSRRLSPEAKKALRRLEVLLRLRWTPVKDMAYRQSEEIVYDFAVRGDETFLAGNGGIFVHNTFTMANIIAKRNVPTLVLAHNKTLAAQLFSEFKAFFPENEVHYFVSYFDYYQPEAYIASSDTYIEKDSAINEEIDRLRHAATDALLTKRDTIIVASVSCIYGIGSPSDYSSLAVRLKKGERRLRDKLLRHLTDIQYHRNDIDFSRGNFRVRGDVVDIFPAGGESALRVEFFGDEVERITRINALTGEIINEPSEVTIFPGSHFVTPEDKLKHALGKIRAELDERLNYFEKNNKYLEAQRLQQRTKFDLEMLEETGFVKGIENYSRYLTDREPGEQPMTLMDYFPDDFLMFIDESHMTLPQVRGMYNGDRARKEILVEHGFRLPSALDNRPLRFDEFTTHLNQVIYVSATPAEYELQRSPKATEQIIRPTGLIDPEIQVRPIEGQIDDLIAEIKDRTAKHQRVLVTTLTKRMAEDLSAYLQDLDIKTAYIHSDVDTLERSDILRDLRTGVYDVLVGINLLREGLDLPEVSLVAIMDADKEGFLRSAPALIQTIGRAARHVDGTVLMYADVITGSMRAAMDETNRRRDIQRTYNEEHGITPTSIAKAIDEGIRAVIPKSEEKKPTIDLKKIPRDELPGLVKDLTAQMELAAANLEFEKAAELRDTLNDIKKKL